MRFSEQQRGASLNKSRRIGPDRTLLDVCVLMINILASVP
jgi:hypothetical protein